MQDLKKPKVSIGMPVYNSDKTLEGAILSILDQTFVDFELIISDNASTDKTQEICKNFEKKDKRIRYIRQKKNIGILNNFKEVLNLSSSDYFMWMAGDDRKSKEFISLAHRALEEDLSIGLVFCNNCIFDLKNNKKLFNERSGFTTSRFKFFRYIFRLHHGGGPALMYGLHRKEILSKFEIKTFDYFDVYMCHWYELNSQISVIPISLHVVGVWGKREAYSIEGSELSNKRYLKESWALLRTHFNYFLSIVLYLLTFLRIKRDTKKSSLKK